MSNKLSDRINDIIENPFLLQYYANVKCKNCYGRGYSIISSPNEFGVWVDNKTLCDCVKKTVEKEVKSDG